MFIPAHGDILDIPADALICSANPFLTLSGGVGGAFLMRYGGDMQDALTRELSLRGVRHVPQGTVVPMLPFASPYRVVLHAVAVDGLYRSTPAIVTKVLAECLLVARMHKARRIAVPALATGYGRLTLEQFSQGLHALPDAAHQDLELLVCLRHEEDVERVLPGNTGLQVRREEKKPCH